MAETIRAEHVTHTFLVPTIIQRLLDAGADVRDAVRTLRQITFGGSPIAPQRLPGRRSSSFGPILTQIYGSSEMPHPVTVLQARGLYRARRSNAAERRTCGLRRRRQDRRRVRRRGRPGPGELLIAGDQGMVGYWHDEAATQGGDHRGRVLPVGRSRPRRLRRARDTAGSAARHGHLRRLEHLPVRGGASALRAPVGRAGRRGRRARHRVGRVRRRIRGCDTARPCELRTTCSPGPARDSPPTRSRAGSCS